MTQKWLSLLASIDGLVCI